MESKSPHDTHVVVFPAACSKKASVANRFDAIPRGEIPIISQSA
jgi:hypothetical protein